jgi:anti-anti-sigma regulatory factor
MTIEVTFPRGEKAPVITICGRFTFDRNAEFLQAINALGGGLESVTVDLRQAESLDSSALGMLIILNDRTRAPVRRLEVLPGSAVEQALQVAQFHRIFQFQQEI